MTSKDEQIRTAIAEQAGEWFVANDAGPLDEQESAALSEWLRASRTHVEEFLGVSVIARDLREACTGPAYSADTLVARARADDDSPGEPLWGRVIAVVAGVPSPHRRAVVVTMAALGIVTLGSLLLWKLMPAGRVPEPAGTVALHFETVHGEQQTHQLADGSLLHLNTDSSVTVEYGKTARLIVLTSGEADFEVAHEAARPFRVFAGAAEVVDLGTKFDVRVGQAGTVVTVSEGRVAVGRSQVSEESRGNSHWEARFVEVGADQQIRVTQGEWPVVPVSVDAQRTTAWLHRQIAFDHEPLERVVEEFNRYTTKPIVIVTPALRNLEISGVFSTERSEAFIAFLRSLEGVRVEVTATQIRVSQK
jgi:transmembrane sensor